MPALVVAAHGPSSDDRAALLLRAVLDAVLFCSCVLLFIILRHDTFHSTRPSRCARMLLVTWRSSRRYSSIIISLHHWPAGDKTCSVPVSIREVFVSSSLGTRDSNLLPPSQRPLITWRHTTILPSLLCPNRGRKLLHPGFWRQPTADGKSRARRRRPGSGTFDGMARRQWWLLASRSHCYPFPLFNLLSIGGLGLVGSCLLLLPLRTHPPANPSFSPSISPHTPLPRLLDPQPF
ncbi:hypothetical protein IWZ00DRAFT_47826 [Phyllosticta capitalensis]